MSRILDRRVLAGVALIVAALIISAATTYRNTNRLHEDAGWVAHTDEVLDLTSEVLLTLIDAETGQRGYVLSNGQDEFLEPYTAAVARLDARLAALKDKTHDDARQQARIAELEKMSVGFLATMRESIDLRKRGVSRLGMYLQLANKGRLQMDDIRKLVGAMQAEENSNLVERRRQSQRSYQVAVTTGLLTALLGLVMVGAFVWLLDRSLRARHAAEIAVREQREWLRTTLASIGDAVIATDTEGRVAVLNGVAATLTGWTEAAAQGQPLDAVFRIVNEDTRQPAENPALRALQEAKTVGLANHTLLIARDGTERPIDDSAAPILDDKGRVTGVVLTFRDITERRRLEKELSKRAAQLAESDRRKDEFLAVLSHELRNPLAPIRNALQIMRVAGDDGATFSQVQGMMERQLGQMVRMVDDLLDVSRISRGKIELRMEHLDLAQVVESALETSRPLIDEAKHLLTVSIPPQPPRVVGDPTRLAQTISNLLNNSAKYTPEGGSIGLAVECASGNVVVRVWDNGVGIPAAELHGVFDLFTQVDRNVQRAQGGLGIGLTLARRLVEMHGGTIEAHSAGEGQGSEFVVRLPMAHEAEEPTREDRSSSEAETTVPGRRILVVDDNQDSAESLGMLLAMLGNEVRSVYDGPRALEAAREFRPDVVLLDIGLPGMSGYDVARRMREMPETRDALLVAQTGWGQEEDRRRSADAGFDEHLVKPVELLDLKRLLASHAIPNQASTT